VTIEELNRFLIQFILPLSIEKNTLVPYKATRISNEIFFFAEHDALKHLVKCGKNYYEMTQEVGFSCATCAMH
jgi:hypothetical protein